MAQQAGTVNFVIHDTNGNPQYIKVQASNPNKTIKAIPQEAVKTILSQKSGTVAQVVNATGTVIPPGAQVLRTLSIQGKPRQLVTIPVQTPIQSLIKTEHTTVTSKPVQISNSQPVMIQTNSQKTYTTLLDHTGVSRKRQENENDFMPEYSTTGTKRRKTEKGGKGLRHFSMKVCEKVRKKGTTSYNEVADELVAEFTNPNLVPNSVDQQYDQKNIRRRVYDALNVLMAMNIISKEKKEIRWLGLPTNSSQESVSLISEKKQIAERIKQKTQQLNELILQQISYKNLIQRNFEMEKLRGPPPTNTTIQLPFIVVNSDRKTIIDCSITNDKTEYRFVFNDKFEIHDDFEILKQIGLTMGLEKGAISENDLVKIKSMFPKGMEKYITKMATEKPGVLNGFDSGYNKSGQLEYTNCAGPSSDGTNLDHDSPLCETTDEESNISTDIELN